MQGPVPALGLGEATQMASVWTGFDGDWRVAERTTSAQCGVRFPLLDTHPPRYLHP